LVCPHQQREKHEWYRRPAGPGDGRGDQPWSFTIQDIVRQRARRTITDDEAMRLMVVTLGTAVMNFEEQRLNKLEGKAEGLC
jgi:hypothetical protein